MPRKKKAKSEMPAFDAKCKNCDRAIPSPLIYCSSKCRRQYEGITLKEPISIRNEKRMEGKERRILQKELTW